MVLKKNKTKSIIYSYFIQSRGHMPFLIASLYKWHTPLLLPLDWVRTASLFDQTSANYLSYIATVLIFHPPYKKLGVASSYYISSLQHAIYNPVHLIPTFPFCHSPPQYHYFKCKLTVNIRWHYERNGHNNKAPTLICMVKISFINYIQYLISFRILPTLFL